MFIEAEDDGGGGDNWSYKSCKAPVTSSPPANQHPVYHRPNALLPWIIVMLIFTSQHNGEGYVTFTVCVRLSVCEITQSVVNGIQCSCGWL